MSTKTKLKIVKLNVKHEFTADEISALNLQYRQADKSIGDLEDEADSIKKSYNAKIASVYLHIIHLSSQ